MSRATLCQAFLALQSKFSFYLVKVAITPHHYKQLQGSQSSISIYFIFIFASKYLFILFPHRKYLP